MRRFVRALNCVVSIGRIVKILGNIVKIITILRFDGEEGRVVVVDGLDVGIAFDVVRGVAFLLRNETTEIKPSVGVFGAYRRYMSGRRGAAYVGGRGQYAPGCGWSRVGDDGGRK